MIIQYYQFGNIIKKTNKINFASIYRKLDPSLPAVSEEGGDKGDED